MRHETDILATVDEIVMLARSLEILRRPDLTLFQANKMIETMRAEYKVNHRLKEISDETWEEPVRSDLQELIDDDNRERARDMIAELR